MPTTPQSESIVDSTKESRPERDTTGRGPSTPPSVLALAAAAQRASMTRRPATPNHSHRRSQTIVVAGDLELEQIQKHKAVEDLHSELESKSKELEVSQEETQLAARIGQTLLQRNQEMGAENESKAIELQNRVETAEQERLVMEHKLSAAISQIRSLDMARTRASLEAEQLTQELDEARTWMQSLKTDLARANAESHSVRLDNKRLEEELESSRSVVGSMEAAQFKLEAELASKNERIEMLISTERYNVEHISRLEIENQSICQQHYMVVRREKQLQFENDAAVTKITTQNNLIKECQARNQELENAIVGFHGEMEDLRDALNAEQVRVSQLARRNQELEARLDHQRVQSQDPLDSDDESTQVLRTGSLFYELARQIKEEINDAREHQYQHAPDDVLKQKDDEEETPEERSDGSVSSPARSSTRTSRNPSSNTTDILEENELPSASSPMEEPEAKRLPPLQLERRRSQQDDAVESVYGIPVTTKKRSQDEEEDGSILKEFFLLTAAAVKSAGGGLRNDACNILNEDLYEEAMEEGVTFDQFHKWLECRLEDDLEISLSPVKPQREVTRKASIQPAIVQAPPPTPSQQWIGINYFWSR